MAAEDGSQNVIQRHLEYLMTHVEPDYGLLEILLSNDVLSWLEVLSIKAENTFFARNSKLLEHISRHNRFNDFVGALRDANQKHLINYVNENGNYIPEFNDDWPLSEKESRILNANQGSLIELIDTTELVNEMYSSGVVNRRQRDAISSKTTPCDKAESLLDILRRRSLRDYKTTIECLHKTNQGHVAAILEKGGVVMKVHASLEETSENVHTLEEELVSAITRLLANNASPDSNRILELVRLRLISVSVGQSVVMYFHCETQKDLFRLNKGMTSDQLQINIQTVFNRLITVSKKIRVTINWYADDYDRCLRYFQVSSLLTAKFVSYLDTPVGCFIYGAAKMYDSIYVLCQSPKAILVYQDTEPYSIQSDIETEEIETPEDIAGSGVADCLYVTDCENTCVWKITMDHRVVKWLDDIDDPWTLSVSSDGCVIMARNGRPPSSKATWKGTSFVEIYDPDGCLVRCLEMPTDMRDLLHAVPTTTGAIVVSFFSTTSSSWSVCGISRDGSIMHRFSPKTRFHQLYEPCHLSLDTEGRVFLADSFRVVLLNKELQWQRILLPEDIDDDIDNPQRLCYDFSKQQLIVHHQGGIYIYAITQS